MAAFPAIHDECSLQGVVEMHLHGDPDSPAQWWADNKIALLERHRAEGYRAVLFIGNNWPTHNDAFLLSRQVQGIEVFGGLTLNLCHGQTLNTTAAERCLNDAASSFFRCIWLPTMDADFDLRKKGRRGISVLDAHGRPLPETLNLMALCRDADIMLGTGHCGPEAAVILAGAAREVGFEKLVVTQSLLSPRALDMEQVRRCLDAGAYLEHVALAAFKGEGHTSIPAHKKHGHTSPAQMARCIELAPERQFLATDMNQRSNPHPVEAMRFLLRELKAAGLSREAILQVSRRTPARLLGLEV